MISSNIKIAKALDIKEDLGIECLVYCKHRLNLRHKDNKMTSNRCFSGRLHALQPLLITHLEVNMQGGCMKARQVLRALVTSQDTSKRLAKMMKDWVIGAGYYLGAWTATKFD
jgi:hypothetical protein